MGLVPNRAMQMVAEISNRDVAEHWPSIRLLVGPARWDGAGRNVSLRPIITQIAIDDVPQQTLKTSVLNSVLNEITAVRFY